MTAIARGQLEGLAEAYERHGGSVFSTALRLCGADLAATATRAAFMCLWRTPLMFDPSRGSLRTCLVTHAQARAVILLRAPGTQRIRDGTAARRAVAPRQPFLVRSARAAIENRTAQTSSGSRREATSSTRPRPSSGHPQTR